MQELINNQNLMSSKQIAERTGKQHSNVLRDIKEMLQVLKIDDSNLNHLYCQVFKDSRGYTSEYLLNEELCLCLATGYSTELRMLLIQDWTKLKLQQFQPKELSRKELAQMVIQVEEEKEVLQLENKKLEIEVKALAPKAEYLDIVLKSVDSLTTTSVASELGMTAQKLNKELLTKGIQRKVDNHFILTGKYVDKGYANNRTHSRTNENGITHTKQYLVWTERGKAFLHMIFNENLSFSKVPKNSVSTTHRHQSL